MNRFRPHRIARVHYLPRAAAFAMTWLGSFALYFDGVLGRAHMAYGALALLLYPQLVHLHAGLARDPKRVALRNLTLDAFVVATWVAVCGFNFGVFYGLFASISFNHAMNGGLRAVLRGVAAFAAGLLVTLPVVGWHFAPDSSPVTGYVALAILYVYILSVAQLFFAQNRQLAKVNKESGRRQAAFAALASAGVAAAEARTLEQLVDTTLDHLARTLPDGAGMGLVVRAPQRPRVVHHAGFRGLAEAAQATLLQACRERSVQALDAGLPAVDGAAFEARVVGAGSAQAETLFLLRDPASLDALQREALGLFLQQFASALANYWLTRSLTELANTDRLTGLANRGRLDARLDELIALRQAGAAGDFTVIVADLNGLKHANDSFGHAVGDHLIAETARLLQRNCRDTDVVARLGGDEFAVLCPATTAPEAAVLVERLRAALAALRLELPGLAPGALQVSLSLGWADTRECEPAQAMRLADSRMYADKQAHYRRRAETASS